ncbi:HHL1-like protein [Laspinema palackyanum]
MGKCNRPKKTGKCTAKRAAAAQKYEKMKEGERPEFHVFR